MGMKGRERKREREYRKKGKGRENVRGRKRTVIGDERKIMSTPGEAGRKKQGEKK